MLPRLSESLKQCFQDEVIVKSTKPVSKTSNWKLCKNAVT